MRAHPFLFALVIACSNSNDKNDAGTDTDSGGTKDSTFGGPQLTGTVIAYESMAMLPMANVAIPGGASAMTDDKGAYTLSVVKGTPFSLKVTGEQYINLNEQEAILMGDAKKDETLVRISTQESLKAFLPNYDKAKAALIVGVTKKATCASSEGAIVDLEPAQPGSIRSYTQGGLPFAGRAYAADGQRIFFYNIDPKANVKIKLTWAVPDDSGAAMQPAKPCTMVAYPLADPDQPNLTYTGNVVLEAGDAISYERLYLQ